MIQGLLQSCSSSLSYTHGSLHLHQRRGEREPETSSLFSLILRQSLVPGQNYYWFFLCFLLSLFLSSLSSLMQNKGERLEAFKLVMKHKPQITWTGLFLALRHRQRREEVNRCHLTLMKWNQVKKAQERQLCMDAREEQLPCLCLHLHMLW